MASDIETVAKWLGAEYAVKQIGPDECLSRKTNCDEYFLWDYIDPDQELGAILRRAQELFDSVYLCMDTTGMSGKQWEFTVIKDNGPPESFGYGPTPLAAARAAVVKLAEAK